MSMLYVMACCGIAAMLSSCSKEQGPGLSNGVNTPASNHTDPIQQLRDFRKHLTLSNAQSDTKSEETLSLEQALWDVENHFNPTGDGEGEYYATVCLLEDSIVGWQTTSSGLDREYVFRNVFRGTLNGADGKLVSNGSFYAEDSFATTCNMELDSTYNADQCYILTYIYDHQDGKILQTAVKKIK